MYLEDAVMVKTLRMPLEAGSLDDQWNRDVIALSLILSVLAPHEET